MSCRTLVIPVLEELKKDSGGKLQVHFIDTAKYPHMKKKYGMRGAGPMWIFYNEKRKELFRKGGHYTKPAILDKWEELGFTF